LESETGEQHQATPKPLNAYAIGDVALQNHHSMCVGKTSPFLHGASSHSSSRSGYRDVAAQEIASLLDRRSYCVGVRPDSLLNSLVR
jgi:hypothetical protein